MEIRFAILMGLYYFMIFCSIYWLLYYFRNRHKVSKDPKPKRFPKVSIIIPVWNEEATIERAIDSCLELNYPDKEIIVVNDGSTDRTEALCRPYAKRGDIVLISKKNGGKASALNQGIKRASGELVSCIDSDSYFTKDALLNMVGYFSDKKVAAVTPAMKITDERTFWQKIQVIEYYFSIYLRKLFSFAGCQYVTPGPGSVYRKSVLERIGGFDPGNITEDMEIAFRIVDNGYRIENSVNAVTYTDAPAGFWGLVKQRVRWYAGYFENVNKYRNMLFNPDFSVLGMFLLPSNFLWIFALFFITYMGLDAAIESFSTSIRGLMAINFDIFPLLMNMDLNIDLLFSINPLTVFGLLFTLLTVVIIYLSYRVSGEKISRGHVPHMLGYFFVYFFMLSFFYASAIFYKALRGGSTEWVGDRM